MVLSGLLAALGAFAIQTWTILIGPTLALTVSEKARFDMTKNAKRAVPSKALLASVDSVLQWFREKARNEDRRSDAQHYADTQWLIRHDIKANARLDRQEEAR